ncbi:Adaptin N terminal region family protein [Trichomonas vaginalis G3]|uniref:AP complex subunit beta n=1 Tax=Trichomonas vaginalis (strain ATCC PRA-98 / G3) TaxID=412133 RepID=A2DFI8_TRIV3|nr:adaptor complex subunit beta family member family [Trichomonas vaginalis G3]EAY20916.1 Adaptin N terminal region family protein [Trichomonas vaginalis G3]KAI5521473.1 adaptor complex subunit beta family member family [Trichomonas vaginalis G3]|eukprot:XP_001581902.1 Adaptin N terminal region family protein [Trichomonas vaginalis G3]
MSYESYTSTSVTTTTTEEPKKSSNLELFPTIQNNLQSTKVADKLNGIKALLAVMSKGEDVSSFFPLVVQEITSEDEALRHLSYIYLVHYAENDPDSALMSVNTFQRSLTDSDPIVRAMALKVLSSIRNTEIIEIVLDSVTRCALDLSPYVRKAAALAVVKINETSPDYIEELIPIVQRLLNDQSLVTISGALYAAEKICPDRDILLHPIYRTLCQALNRLDPWGQAIAMHMLQRYARRNFPKPSGSADWFSDDEEGASLDPDLDLLIKSVQPLLASITPSVVIAAASLFFYCAPPLKVPLIAKPLIRLLYVDSATAYAALLSIASFVADNAEPFIPHIRHFFLFDDEPIFIMKLKLQVLSQLARPSNSDILMRELSQYIYNPDQDIATEAVKAIGRTASLAGDSSVSCIDVIVKMLSSPVQSVVNQAARVLSLLLRNLPKQTPKSKDDDDLFGATNPMDKEEVVSILKKLLKAFIKITDSETKACVMSIVGDKCELIPEYAHEVLRRVTNDFANSDPCVKLAALELSAKVLYVRPKESVELVKYVLTLGFYDQNINVRDRARLIHSLLTANTSQNYILEIRKTPKKFVLPDKSDVVWGVDSVKASNIEAGTISQIIGKVINKTSLVVPWVDPSTLPEKNPRDEPLEIIESAPADEIRAKKDLEEEDLNDYFGTSEDQKIENVVKSAFGEEEEKENKEEDAKIFGDVDEEKKEDENLDDYFS